MTINLCLVLWLALAFYVRAGSHSADSNVTTVDTTTGLRTIIGRVLDAKTSAAVPGATVTYFGSTRTTDNSGAYLYSGGSWPAGQTLSVSKTGYNTSSLTLSVTPGTREVVVADVLLGKLGDLVITGIEPKINGIFIAGVSVINEYKAKVSWGGRTPKAIEFSNKKDWQTSVLTTSTEVSISLDVNSVFTPSLRPGENVLRAVAVCADGTRSEPYDFEVGFIPLPRVLEWLASFYPFTAYITGQIGVDGDFPNPPIKSYVTLPVLGKFGVEVAANLSFDYTIQDGDWELALGVGAEGTQGKRGRRPLIPMLTRYPKMKLYLGNKEISGKIQGGAGGTATWSRGITFDKVFGHGEIKAKLELTRYGLLDLLGPGLTKALSKVPKLDEMTKNTSVLIWALPGIEGDLTFAVDPQFKFDSLELTGKVGIEASYEPNVGFGKAKVYIGGEPSVTLQIPGDLLKELRFRVYAGFESEIWIFNFGPVEYVFCDFRYPSAGLKAQGVLMEPAEIFRLPVAGTGDAPLRPITRGYLESGPERFVVSDSLVELLSPKAGTLSPLEAFRSMGRSVNSRPNMAGKEVRAAARAQSIPIPAQADLTLVQNAFPNSQPALAGQGSELMLLYVTDNGASNALQFTDIRWTFWDGENWSNPQNIETNTRAEFSPQVAYDGSGNILALWERVADPNFNETNLTAMAAQMEIVWSKWNWTNGNWSTPLPLTDNSVLDHAPLVCGPMSDGSILAVWTRNNANLLMGTNGAGSQVLWSRWNSSSQSWSAEQPLINDLAFRLSQSLAGASNRAVYAWTRDLDGVLTNASDQQVFYCEWSGASWGAAKQFTTNALGNQNARIAVSQAQDVYLVWQQGTNLVMNRNFSTNITLVRADSQTAGFADFAMTIGPAGNLVLLWQEMSEDGSDAYFTVYDPASDTWSKDARLFRDPPLERSFAPVWDAAGNLTFAYNKVEILHTNKTLTLEGGEIITITNVPQSGRVDLCVTKRALIRDLELKSGDLTVSGVNYLPGDPLNLAATVRNAGNVAMSNVVVAFYDGNPTNNGVLITNVTLAGWLEGAATNTASAVWIMPETTTRHVLYAVVNPSGMATEFTATNNTQSLRVGGTDLMVSLLSQKAETNGALRVIAQVQNLGAPTATNSVLAIRRSDSTGTNVVDPPLATVNVSPLEPGRIAQLAFDLPAGTQPEGEAFYQLRTDETGVIDDVDTQNNATTFSVNLWIDSDNDGLPDGWMTNYFGHATGLETDLSRAQDDADGDGASNLAEYRSGTAPNDPRSYLFLTAISGTGTSGIQVAWGSTPNRLYTIQRATSLSQDGSGFTNLAEHILSKAPENVYLDATATNGAAFFYRVKVE